MIHLVIPGQPERITEQQHRFGGYSKNGKAIIYRDTRLQRARDRMIQGMMPYRPDQPLNGPLMLIVAWYFGTKDKKKILSNWKTTRPDTDNLLKGLKDCLTECGYCADDAQFAYEITSKRWVPLDKARIYIGIARLENKEIEK